MDKSILRKFKEIKDNHIIKDYKPIFHNNELVDVDIEYFNDNPIFTELKLDVYLIKKNGIRNVKRDLFTILLYGILTNFKLID